MALGEPFVFEDGFRDSTVENRVHPIVDGEGRVRRLAILGVDVTERKRWETRLEYLLKSTDRIGDEGSVEGIYDAVMAILKDGFQFGWAGVAVVGEERLRYVRFAGVDPGINSIPLTRKSVLVRAVTSGASQLVPDAGVDPDYYGGENGQRSGSELAVPVFVHGKPSVVINIESSAPKALNYGDQRIVELLALHMGRAIELVLNKEKLDAYERERLRDVLDSAKRTVWAVSRDLMAPLKAVEEGSYLLRQDPSKAEIVLDAIDRNVRQAVAALDDFAVVTAPEQLRRRIVDLNELVEGVLCSIVAPEGVRVESSFETAFTAKSVDPDIMRRVVRNLVENALDVMPNGGTLQVEVRGDGSSVELSVSDTGVGMIPAVADNVFKPFFSTKEGRFGLGLAFCKQAVELHGGTISVESEPGKGSVFTVRLP